MVDQSGNPSPLFLLLHLTLEYWNLSSLCVVFKRACQSRLLHGSLFETLCWMFQSGVGSLHWPILERTEKKNTNFTDMNPEHKHPSNTETSHKASVQEFPRRCSIYVSVLWHPSQWRVLKYRSDWCEWWCVWTGYRCVWGQRQSLKSHVVSDTPLKEAVQSDPSVFLSGSHWKC